MIYYKHMLQNNCYNLNFIVVRKYHVFHLYLSDSQPYLHKTFPPMSHHSFKS